MIWFLSSRKNINTTKCVCCLALLVYIGLATSLAVAVVPTATLTSIPVKPIGDLIHETWSVDDGLPQSTIRSMAQTRDGYLWFATHEGVARFDGQKFTVFNEANTPALRGSGVAALREARDGSLYLGLRDGGLVRYQREEFTAVIPVGGLPKGSVSVLEEDGSGRLWIGTSGGGLATLSVADNTTRGYTTLEGLPHDIVTAIRTTASGDVWIGTFGGLSLVRNGKLTSRPTGEKIDTIYISSILEDSSGRLWVATYGNGLYCREAMKPAAGATGGAEKSDVRPRLQSGTQAGSPSGPQFRSYTRRDGLASDTLTRVFEDRAGNIWLGSLEGIQRFSNTATNPKLSASSGGLFETYNSRNGLSNNFVRDILQDVEGSMWFGTDRGIDRFREGLFTTWGAQRGLSEEFSRTVLEDRSGAIWVGTSDGLFRFSGQNIRRYGRKEGLLNSAILSLTEGQDGTIWVGTNAGGMHRLRQDRLENLGGKLGLGASSVRSILETRDGALWMGTNTGLYRVERAERVALEMMKTKTAGPSAGGMVRRYRGVDGLAGDQVISLYEDSANVVWVGTREGLATINNGIITKHAQLGSSGPILSISADAKDELTITTANGFALIMAGKAHLFQSAQGIPARAFLSAVDDQKGHLWLCSNQGIVRLNNQELKEVIAGKRERVTPDFYGRSDGMATVQCNGGSAPAAWRTRDGRLMFATARGVAMVDAVKQSKPNLMPPPVHITSVLVDSESMPLTGHVVMRPGKHRLEILYVGLSLADPAKVRYRYRLHGFDPEWIEAGSERRAIYTNLEPGQYQFQVRASNNDGLWNDDGAMLTIDYQPQFFERGVFRWMAALLLVALGFTAYFVRVRILRHQAFSLQQLVDERTRDLALEKEKLERTNEEKASLLVQVKEQSAAYEQLSKTDALTGLANRRELERFLSLEFERAWRNQRPLCVVLADLDQFKQVNDQFSHAVGDDVMRTVARILMEGCRAIDMVARYGGEEFAIVLPETEIAEARLLCERLRSEVEKFNWSSIRPGLSITMSFGIAAHTAHTANTADPAMDHDKLLDAADAQLYAAKRAGRNKVLG